MTAMLQAQMEVLFAPEAYTSGQKPVLTEAELHAEGFMAALPPVPTVLTSVQGAYTSDRQPALTEAELRAEGFMAALPPVPTVLTSAPGVYTSGLQPALTETELHAGGFSKAQHEAQMGSTCVGVVGDAADESRVNYGDGDS